MTKPIRLLAWLLGTLPVVAAAMHPEGTPVTKIPFASQISGWHALDKNRLILSLTHSRNYLVTLRQACHPLGFAAHVGVSTSNDTIYAGFDYITADGQRCPIERINEITAEQKKSLVRA